MMETKVIEEKGIDPFQSPLDLLSRWKACVGDDETDSIQRILSQAKRMKVM
jgi:hypothetical protein